MVRASSSADRARKGYRDKQQQQGQQQQQQGQQQQQATRVSVEGVECGTGLGHQKAKGSVPWHSSAMAAVNKEKAIRCTPEGCIRQHTA
jgi:hypothetical protein